MIDHAAKGTDKVQLIVEKCLELDGIAVAAYDEMTTLTDDASIKHLWSVMSAEESSHVHFWRKLAETGRHMPFPDIFDDADKLLEALDRTLAQYEPLMDEVRETRTPSSMFLAACRMEIYMLHPALTRLFVFADQLNDLDSPAADYDAHIDHLVAAINQRDDLSGAMQLVGEALERLWHENRMLATEVAIDGLTGLPRRQQFFSLGLHLAHVAQRQAMPVAILMIDIDCFKRINDEHGHPAGDQVLARVGRHIAAQTRHSDVAGRYGGEEFIVMMLDSDATGAHRAAIRFREAIATPAANSPSVTVSVGLASARLGQDIQGSFHELIQKADQALLQAKRAGRDRVNVYTD